LDRHIRTVLAHGVGKNRNIKKKWEEEKESSNPFMEREEGAKVGAAIQAPTTRVVGPWRYEESVAQRQSRQQGISNLN